MLAIGLALAPWNVLAGGRLRTDAEEERRRQTGEKGRMVFHPNWERNDNEKKMSNALEKVAKEVGTEHITAGEWAQGLVPGILVVDPFEYIQSRSHTSSRRYLTCSQSSEVARLSICSEISKLLPSLSRPSTSLFSKA